MNKKMDEAFRVNEKKSFKERAKDKWSTKKKPIIELALIVGIGAAAVVLVKHATAANVVKHEEIIDVEAVVKDAA